MAKFARLTAAASGGDMVIEIFEAANAAALGDRLHPDIVAGLVTVPATAVVGSVKTGSTWSHPAPVVPPAPVEPPAPEKRKTVSRTEYYGLFTATEEAMIRIAASEEVTAAALAAGNAAEKTRLMGVAALQVMLRRTDALGPADVIDLGSAQVQQGLGLLVQAGLLTAARKTAIEAGV